MKKKIRKINLRQFLILVSSGITLTIITILFVLLYYSASMYMKNMVKNINRSDFDHLVTSIEKKYNQIFNISRCIYNSTDLKKMILNYNEGNFDLHISEKIVLMNHINDFITSLQNYNNEIKSINLVSHKNTFYSNPPFISNDIEANLYNERLEKFKLVYPPNVEALNNVPTENSIIKDFNDKIYLSFGLYDSSNYYGNIYILLRNDFFATIADNRKNVLITDENGVVIYNTIGNNTKSSKIIEAIKSFDITTLSEDVFIKKLANKWTVASIPDTSILSPRKETLNRIMIFASLICLISSFTLSYFLSKSILRPVHSLVHFMFNYSITNGNDDRYTSEKKKKRITTKTKIFLYLIMTILVPITVFIVQFNLSIVNWSKEQIFHQYTDTFNKAVEFTEDLIYQKAMVFQNIVYNTAFQQYIFAEDQTDEELVIETLKNYRYLGLGNNEITVYDKNGLVFSNYILTALENQRNMPTILHLRNEFLWESGIDSLGNNIFTISTRINKITAQLYREEPIFASLLIPAAEIIEAFDSLQTGTNDVFISNNYGKNILNTNSENISKTEFPDDNGKYEIGSNNQRFMFFYRRIPKTPWFLVFKYRYEDIDNESRSIIVSNTYIIIIIILLIIVLSYITSMLILRPVNAFNLTLAEYKIDDINADMLERSYINEIDSLGVNFNKMIDRMESLFDDLLISNREKNQLQLKIKASEMVALQAQINPHFLYNTLENLIYLIESGKKKEAKQVVFSLSQLFKFGISRGDRIISIGEEISYAKAYSNIISIRYGDGISFNWDIDKKLLERKTLKLILQPLIENAVLHGFKRMTSNCEISIKCHKQNQTIIFTVEDNGQGIPEDILNNIKQELEKDDVEDRVGIYNVQARIRLQYGMNYGIHIQNREDSGACVKIIIPCCDCDED